CFIRNCPP
uniref:Conopressin-Tx n=1 Tax=Conus textile TaxID=6494 RepID=CONO_CONTE|nr:RecName: Full=Conopressin-Tx [Conus textile]